jgi:hypothetical protein
MPGCHVYKEYFTSMTRQLSRAKTDYKVTKWLRLVTKSFSGETDNIIDKYKNTFYYEGT